MIEVFEESFPLARAFTISRGSRSAAQVLSVRICRDGHEARGECVPYARYGESLDSVRAQIEALPDGMSRLELQEALPPGAARNAVDCALWDLEAKRTGVPVWQLAGLERPKALITAYTLSLDTAEAMEARAREEAHRPILKIKLGTPDDMARLEAVRRGAPHSTIIVDANEGWSAEVYSDLAPHLVRLGVALVEQPVPAGEDAALIGLARPVPVCADESCHDRASLPGLAGKYDMARQARQDRRSDRGVGIARCRAGGGAQGLGGLHGRLVARHGACASGGAGRGGGRSRRALAACRGSRAADAA